MAEINLDMDFVKTNLDQSKMISQVIIGAGKGLITTVIILGSIISVLNISNISLAIQNYVYASVSIALLLAIAIPAFHYRNKITGFADLAYTTKIDEDENIWFLSKAGISAATTGIALSTVALVSQQYLGLLTNIGACSTVSTGFLWYIFKNRLLTYMDYLKYACIGIATGTAAYGLGALVILAVGFIGLWVTVAIVSLEVTFTAIYTYLGLLDWVVEEKRNRANALMWEEKRKADALAREQQATP